MMHKFLQNKLWRDKMPEQLNKAGSVVHVLPLNDTEYDQQLRIKLSEETEEVCVAQSHEQLVEELADLYEVIDALCLLHKIDKETVHATQSKKRDKRGGFYERAFVTIAEHPAGSFGEHYCREQPNKYPEVT
jgi:predicted house-cleaning noncanonical NTP pyrophosphatase (MazG superfamily)